MADAMPPAPAPIIWKAPNTRQAPIWSPNAGQQAKAYGCPYPEILYGGAAGGGKTDWLAGAALHHALTHPGARVLLLRRNLTDAPDLRDRVAALCRQVPGTRQNRSDRTWRLPNGSVIELGFTADGVDRYMGREFTFLGIDELTLTVPDLATYQLLRSRLRSPHGIPTVTRCTTNPRGPYLAWVRARFVEGAEPETPQMDAHGRARVFVPGLLSDNPHLPPEYRAALEDLPERDRKALLLGDWYAFSGAVFRLSAGRGLVSRAEAHKAWGGPTPPSWWPRFRGYDWGFASPAGCVWAAADPEGRLWVYREWYVASGPGEGARVQTRAQGERIAQIEREAHESVVGVADPACWNKGQGAANGQPGPSAIEELQAGGAWGWQRGDNNRVAGWQQIGKRIEFDGLRIVQEDCPELLRSLAGMEPDERHPEDCDSSGDDHLPDALRYLCMMRPWSRRSDPANVSPWVAAGAEHNAVLLKTAYWGRK